MIRNQSNSEVRAVAAAAITITYRGTYMYHAHTSYAGDKGVPETKVFETKNCLVDFSKFTIFQLLGMVRWKNAHFEKQKTRKKQKTRFFGPRGSSRVEPQCSSSTIQCSLAKMARSSTYFHMIASRSTLLEYEFFIFFDIRRVLQNVKNRVSKSTFFLL